MYDHILVPSDGSPGADAAIEHAIHIARQNDAVLHAVHVADVIDGALGDGGDVALREAQDMLGPVVEAADEAGLESVEEVLEGTPHERIVEYADAEGIDLIVMGTHGKSGISRVLLGSTAETVVRESPVPVLTVRE